MLLETSSGWYSQRHSRSRAQNVKKKTETETLNEVDVYKLLNNYVQIKPRKHVISVRWNTLVKILGLLKLFKFHLHLNLIKNKEWKQLSVLNTEHKVYNLIKIEARWDGNDKTITARLGKRKMKLSFNYNFNLDVTQKDGGLECEFWESQTNNVSTVFAGSNKNCY